MNKPVCLFVALSAGMFPAIVAGQTCQGNQTLSGPYVMIATRMYATQAAPPATGTVTNPAPPQYSNTLIGQMVKGANATAPFALTGRIVADGAGILFAAPADAQYYVTRVGTYTVNSDCTISMRLVDGQLNAINFFGDTVPGPYASFQGVANERGSDVSFIQTGQGAETLIQLSRPFYAQSCTNASMSGAFGVFLTGVDTGTADAPALTPFSMLGRFVSDGAGTFYPDTPALESPQPKRVITGSYKILSDCTGTARFVIDGVTRNVTLVLSQGGVSFGQIQRAAVKMVLNDGRIVAVGEAR